MPRSSPALSSQDLIPDLIPVVGYLDGLIIVPFGTAAVLRLAPAEILDDCRAHAPTRGQRPESWLGAAIVVGAWLVAAAWLVLIARNLLAFWLIRM